MDPPTPEQTRKALSALGFSAALLGGIVLGMRMQDGAHNIEKRINQYKDAYRLLRE